MSQTQACSKCSSETQTTYRKPLALETDTSKQDDTYLQTSTNNVTTRSHPSDDKQNAHDPSSNSKDFNMALTLFPEFLLQDTYKDWRPGSLCDNEKRQMNTKEGFFPNSGANHKFTEHLKNSKDIVEWVRKEYGM